LEAMICYCVVNF